MSLVVRNPVFEVSDINRAVQPQNMSRGMKFRKKRDCTIRLAKTKALISYCEADLRLCFRISKNRFSHDVAHIIDLCLSVIQTCVGVIHSESHKWSAIILASNHLGLI